MICFNWDSGRLVAGIPLTVDDKFGKIVFLGEEGRSRYFEKVGLGKRNPAPVRGGHVTHAKPIKVSVGRGFWVLEKPDAGGWDALIRVCTNSGYVRGGSGRWEIVAGKPELIVQGHGAFGGAGNVGSWDDGLIHMRPGDVLKIHPTCAVEGVSWFALWVEESGEVRSATWEEYENLKAVAKAKDIVGEVVAGKGSEIVFGVMNAKTFTGNGFEDGIAVDTGVTGPSIVLGTTGRGRHEAHVAMLGVGGFVADGRLFAAAAAKLSEEEVPARWYGEAPTKKTIWGLVDAERVEDGAILLRVKPSGFNRVHLEVKTVRGNPVQLAAGNFAGGDAGRVDSTPDELWVIHEGDILAVGHYDRPLRRVIECLGGNLSVSTQDEWEERDGLVNPDPYVQKGRAPWGHIPADWIGRVVVVERWEKQEIRREWIDQLVSREEGELVEIGDGSISLNLGWDGRDRQVIRVTSGVWVRDTGNKVVRAEPDREDRKADATRLQADAESVVKAGYFVCLPAELQAEIRRVSRMEHSSRYSEGLFHPASASTDDIRRWNEWAAGVMSEARIGSKAAEAMRLRQEGGEVLANFSAFKRRGSATGCGQGWVIRPDGTLRVHDSMEKPRPRYDEGTQRWELVQPDELALEWSKAYTAAPHVFKVAKLPVGGLTDAQLATVGEIERELANECDGKRGMSGNTSSPPVGEGWGLKPIAPKPAAKDVPSGAEAKRSGPPATESGLAALANRFPGQRRK